MCGILYGVMVYGRGYMYTIYNADIVDWLQHYRGEKFHAVLSDPPYGLAFMGKSWDTMSAKEYHKWVTQWATLLLDVVYPGAVLVMFGGTRTYHRLACGLEDAGWDIFDSCMYLYGSGFPKSHDISLALDKVATAEATQWFGYGTALKPAFEPIVLARAPRDSTYAHQAVTYGTGALNIDASRICAHDSQLAEKYASIKNAPPRDNSVYGKDKRERSEGKVIPHNNGRFPSNVILDEQVAEILDEQSGSGKYKPRSNNCTVKPFDPDNGWNQHSMNPNSASAPDDYGDIGGASRFFYTAKASSFERNAGLSEKSNHPTVKPIKLTEYFARLILPPALDVPRRLFVPFSGVGSEIIGANLAGWEYIVGVERHTEYIVESYDRLRWWDQFSSYEDAKKHKNRAPIVWIS